MNQKRLIQDAWTLTEAIELAVGKEDWEHAASLAEARSPMLMSLQADQPAEALVVIRKIQASINAVASRARAEQVNLSATYCQSMENAKAASQYQQMARF
ncbi:flagellar protein FliT [Caballeronia ptereochthonis]|uniref:Flagellar protein FliT n=1 Tax=Caballeronia ptereochthonis TaxID=1777144 RepID=A0A158DAY0_9BURK|nr:flagellar protein FliT [Caballeronia ptereochthonis]SAK91834.1 Flagellar protein FliT [Caballeronia ptereochthonis]